MEGGENKEPPRFCIEVNVPRGGQKIAVLWLHNGATLQSAVEATVDLHCKTVCFNKLERERERVREGSLPAWLCVVEGSPPT